MSRRRDQRIEQLGDVEREYRVTVVAMTELRRRLAADPSVLTGQGLEKKYFDRAADNLDATYLIRLFAEFETGLREAWRLARRSPPIPERWNCSRLLCPASKSRPTGTWRLTMCESTATFSFTRWMTL